MFVTVSTVVPYAVEWHGSGDGMRERGNESAAFCERSEKYPKEAKVIAAGQHTSFRTDILRRCEVSKVSMIPANGVFRIFVFRFRRSENAATHRTPSIDSVHTCADSTKA